MGGKESKLSYIPYEDVMKRIRDNEMKRLKDAFKRVSSFGGMMTETMFTREVLGDGVPDNISQLLYKGFGGTSKGVSFKDLLTGLIIITKGSKEDKIKLIFGMYADESYTYVQKDDMDRRILETEGQVSTALSDLFLESDQVGFEQFRSWLYHHPDATIITKWLLMEPMTISLSNDTDTPTFYQTLAGVTHLEESDISELDKRYWVLKSQSKSGKFDVETFKALVCPPVPESVCEGLFKAFDENRDNHIDFKEMACGISACCRGPSTERQKFCFKVFDANHDNKLNHAELKSMLNALLLIRFESRSGAELESDMFHKMDPHSVASEILACHDTDKGLKDTYVSKRDNEEQDKHQDGCISMAEYLVWTVNNTLADDFLDLLSQICHIVLGLKPQKREEEGKIVNDWLSRESRKPFRVGQVWYLLAMQWWNSWIEYVSPTAVEANVLLDQNGIEKGSFLDSPVHHRITKGKHQSKTLPWDDDSVIVVNVTKGTNSELGGATNQVRNHTLPRASNHSSVYSSPLRHCLNPGESTVVNRSPSPSPKLRKKNVHSCNSVPPRPGAIDNSQLIALNTTKVSSLTNEGGRLKRDTMLVRGKDFELVPEPVWRALSVWYGTDTPLPRTVIASANNDGIPELELYPVTVRLQRHQMPSQRPAHMTTFTGMMSGIGGMALSMTNFVANSPQTPRRFVAYSATFSQQHTLQQVYEFLCTKLRLNREDMRLWKIGQKEDNMTLLDDENTLIEECALEENQLVLIEIRNKDLTWPEEMSQLAKNKTFRKDQAPTHKGATGLNNLGNTCFMNAAVQCVSNTWPLTHYFIGGLHLFELNRTNPLGMKGHIAQRYGDLVKDLWSGTAKSIAPLKLRWTIGKYAPRFNGFQQHDSQELLSFLLDGLHEDLNRVHDKPYVELKDSDGRPDNTVAEEAWENHLKRNQSIIVDFFHGQLKSEVRCQECSHASVRFDPFNYLSLPLPMESCIHLEVIVMRLEGTVPKKYGLRLNMDEKYRALKRELSKLTNIPFEQILFVEIMGPLVKTLPKDDQKLRTLLGGVLYAYELPPPEDIKPLTVEEEKCSKTKSSLGLNDIQRGLTKAKVQAKLTNGNVPSMSLSTSSDIGSLSTGNTPSHSRNPSDAGMMGSLNGTPENNNSMARSIGDHLFKGFVISVHRKMNLMDVYFLSSQKTRPCLFGTPIILPCSEKTNNLDLYQFVWTQVSRLVSPLPPSEAKSANHAQDCDDSLGYEYPFTLKVVQKDGLTCAWCPWYRFCRGCRLECTADPFNFGSSFIAIDWEPTALHLRYQTSHEKLWEEHSSVEESRRRQTEPIDLDTCLQAFTKEEELGEEELYYCSKCKKHCLAIKKLDIWRLPPILIINLKRFQFLNGKWVKSHKIVKFPIEDFDPSNYIAPTRKAHNKSQNSTTTTSTSISSDESLSQSNHCCQNINTTTHPNPVPNERMWGSVSSGISSDESGSVMDTSDYSQMNGDSRTGDSSESSSLSKPCQLCAANRGNDYSNVKYNLYAMSCHTGILGGGHYVGYAKNPNKKWYCYNDSSCKEIPVGSLDTNSAYILFYEQQGLDFAKFMPDLTGKEPDLQEIEDEFESDFKKMCVLQ
ncbi:Ubiquitin carboxyl-terminal hydrolase 32 [Mizuhopecten yessoensis]|uniref:ubiquitinyl hydrolase 1 n=1 Tax=Mizuhopecten yessoensis TaxID=6573 RepID=A0A210QTU5_MIZYE|nr:Ubiquitin carboxyl-terminal hydrolase 32 [Mizuhopecten yessoensis]